MNANGAVQATTSSGPQPQDVPAEGVVDRQHVAVEVRGDLRDAGAARGRPEQGDVVGRGVDGGELAGLGRRRGGSGRRRRRRRRARRRGPGPRCRGRPRTSSANRWSTRAIDGPGLLDDRVELAGAQRGHRGDDDAAGLEDAEPGGDGPRVVGRAQQHAVAGHQPEVLGQHLRRPGWPGRAARRRSTPSPSGVRSAGPVRRRSSRPCASRSSAAALSRSGYCSVRCRELQRRPLVARAAGGRGRRCRRSRWAGRAGRRHGVLDISGLRGGADHAFLDDGGEVLAVGGEEAAEADAATGVGGDRLLRVEQPAVEAPARAAVEPHGVVEAGGDQTRLRPTAGRGRAAPARGSCSRRRRPAPRGRAARR